MEKTFKLQIRTDNDAFEPLSSNEIARILREVADKLDNSTDDDLWAYQNLHDYNGNVVGEYALKPNDYK